MSQNVKLSEEPTMEPMDSMNVKQNNKYECVFKRGGLCKTHGVMGHRNVKSKQVWKRKKDGTYGWITSKKVEYECEGFSNQMQPVSQSSGSVNIIPEPGIAQIVGMVIHRNWDYQMD